MPWQAPDDGPCPFAVLEVCCPLPATWSTRWEATLGREGRAELLVVESGAAHVPPITVLAPGTDVTVLTVLDEQAAASVAMHGGTTDDYVARLVAEWLAEH